MHIPDGFLDIKTCIATTTVTVGALGYTVNKLKMNIQEKDIPKMGVISAFIFAAQMINFPVAMGTSGHLIGAALATLLLGPLQAIITLTSVVAVQAFIFQDGGIMVLGANILNMAIIPVLVTFFVSKASIFNKYQSVTIVVMGWLSVVISAAVVSIQLALSGTYDLGKVLTLMLFWHILIGIGEGVITYFSYSFINSLMGFENKGKEVAPYGKY